MTLDYDDPKSVERLLHKFCNQVMRRLQAAAITTFQREDIMQELWIAWVIARKSYSADTNVPFVAYLSTGMKRHINRFIEKHAERFLAQTHALSLDYNPDNGFEDANASLSETVPSAFGNTVDIEDNIAWEQAISMMSPQTQIFARLLKDTPSEICEQVIHLREKSKHGRAMGVPSSDPMRVTSRMIFDLLGCTVVQRRKIIAEITEPQPKNVRRKRA